MNIAFTCNLVLPGNSFWVCTHTHIHACIMLLFSHTVTADSATPWTAVHQVFLSLTISWSGPSSSSLHQWCHLAISFSDALFSFCPHSFPASGTFPMSWLFTSDDQNTGASASALVLPMSMQSWVPLRLTGLISLLSRELSGVFPSTTVRRHQFLALSLLYEPTLTSVHDYWKNRSSDYMDLCWQSDVSAF